jgi:hypothetical protein
LLHPAPSKRAGLRAGLFLVSVGVGGPPWPDHAAQLCNEGY